MNKVFAVFPLVSLAVFSGSVHAGLPDVPEFDGSSATIALGLTVGLIALIQEFRRKK